MLVVGMVVRLVALRAALMAETWAGDSVAMSASRQAVQWAETSAVSTVASKAGK